MSPPNHSIPVFMATTLPQELIFQEILPRVPAKSLLKFKSVSKSWHTQISSPHFIKTHLHHWTTLPSGTLTQPKTHQNHTSYPNPETGEHFIIHLVRILNDQNYLTPFASHDGLLVIQSLNNADYQSDSYFYVCNPITQKFVKLPPPPVWLKPCEIVFDETIQRYKVISWAATKGCVVFTFDGTRKVPWRYLGLPLESCGVQSCAVVANGALNWVAELDHRNAF